MTRRLLGGSFLVVISCSAWARDAFGIVALAVLAFTIGCSKPAAISSSEDASGASSSSPITSASPLPIASSVPASSSSSGPTTLSPVNVCYKLQTAGVAYECVSKHDLVGPKNKGLADAAGFRFTSPVYGQVGTPGYVLQFGDIASFRQSMKDLQCGKGGACVGSPGALLIVRTLYGGAPIPNQDWNKIQGVFNEIAPP